MTLGTALVRRPDATLAAGLVTHLERRPVDLDRAMRQWDAYVEALSGSFSIREVEPAPGCPDSVFIEDTVVVVDDLVVITRPGAEARRAETAGARATIEQLGLTITTIEAPGTLDGGDVLKVGRTVYVGRSCRTNEAGIDQLRAVVSTRGATVVVVPVTKVLHLKSAVTALPDGTIIGFLPLVDDPSLFPHFREVPEPSGSHVVVLADDRVLLAADAPRTAELFDGSGFPPVLVDVSEFDKLEGCVTCLSVRVRQPAPMTTR